MTNLDERELLALLKHHRRTIDASERKIAELVREGRRLRVSYQQLMAASGFSRGWLDEIVHGRRTRDSSG